MRNDVGSMGSATVPSLVAGETSSELAAGAVVSTTRVTGAVGPQKPSESWLCR